MKRIYLDYSATTPLDDEVRTVMERVSAETFGNPSSVHSYGREARVILEESREELARELGAARDEVFFTSGGTESDNNALFGIAFWSRDAGRSHVVISAIEHHAVLHAADVLREHRMRVSMLPVDEHGVVHPDALRRALTPETCLVSVMHANNEVGTIQPIAELTAVAHDAGALFHTDAVQSFGKCSLNANELGVDLLSVSAHKVYGPKGIGALYVRKGIRLDPLLHGGGQESGRRPGTENVALTAGFACAIRRMREDRSQHLERMRHCRSYLKNRLEREFGDAVVVNGHPTDVLPTILNISFDRSRSFVDGEALIMGMDLRGIAVTSGSACTSGSLQPSHVLMAMGRDIHTARATIRFSFGKPTTEADLDAAVDALKDALRSASAGTKR